jgi:hypothetical protein
MEEEELPDFARLRRLTIGAQIANLPRKKTQERGLMGAIRPAGIG